MKDQPFHIVAGGSPFKEMTSLDLNLYPGKILDGEGVGECWMLRFTIQTKEGDKYDLVAPTTGMGYSSSILDYLRNFVKECDERMGTK